MSAKGNDNVKGRGRRSRGGEEFEPFFSERWKFRLRRKIKAAGSGTRKTASLYRGHNESGYHITILLRSSF